MSAKEEEETELMKTEMKQIDVTGSRRLRWSSESAEGIKDGWSNERRNDKRLSEKRGSIWHD